MADHLNDYLNAQFGIESKDIRTYSPLTLAYIGDAVFDVIIRSILVNKGNTAVNKLHKRASDIVKAGTQAAFVKALMDDFTEEAAIPNLIPRPRTPLPWTILMLRDLRLLLDTCILLTIWTEYVSL